MKRITKSLFVLMLSCAMSFSIVANSLPIMADEVEETTQENDTNTTETVVEDEPEVVEDTTEASLDEVLGDSSMMEYFLVDSPVVSSQETENFVLSLNNIEGYSNFKIAIQKEDGTTLDLESSETVGNLVKFSNVFSNKGDYQVTSLHYVYNGQPYYLNFSDLEMDVKFGVDQEYVGYDETLPDLTEDTIRSEGVIQVTDVNKAEEEIANGMASEASIMSMDEFSRAATGGMTICLDPGHGGSDSGANAFGQKESALTLKIANYCKEELAKYDVNVVMTRTTDTRPSENAAQDLIDRVMMAKKAGASYIISIHLNSAASTSAHGAEVYFPNTSGNASLSSNGQAMAKAIQSQLVALGLYDRGIKIRNYMDGSTSSNPNSSDRDYYGIIRYAKEQNISGLIIEHCFLNNPDEYNKYLSSDAKLQQLGVADAKGIVSALGLSLKNAYLDQIASENKNLIPDGKYVISSMLNSKYVLDVKNGSMNNSANIELSTFNNETDNQAFIVSHDAQGYITFTNAKSGKVLDVSDGKASNGKNVQQYTSNGTRAQKWVVKKSNKGYMIISALDSNYVLDVSGGKANNGTNVQLYSGNGSDAQNWNIEKFVSKYEKLDALANSNKNTIADGTYEISTKLNTGYVLDMTSSSLSNGGNVQIYESNETPAQGWIVSHDSKGYVTIKNENSGKVMEIKDNKATNLQNVQQNAANDNYGQKWIAIKNSDGSIELVSGKNQNYCLDLYSSRTVNGNNVDIYERNNSNAQRWVFRNKLNYRESLDQLANENKNVLANGTYTIASKINDNYVLDMASSTLSNGGNVQLYEANGTKAQSFIVNHDKNGYVTITNENSNKVIEVNSNSAANMANIQQNQSNDSYRQKWIAIKNSDGSIELVSALNKNYCIDLYSSRIVNGNNVDLYQRNSSNAQKWLFKTKNNQSQVPTNYDAIAAQNKDAIADGKYEIATKLNTSFVLDMTSSSLSNGGNVQLYASNGTKAQGWIVSHDSKGYVTITNENSGKVMEVAGNKVGNLVNVQQNQANSNMGQKWIAMKKADGFIELVSALNTNYCLDLYSSKTVSGNNVEIYEKNGSNAQLWKFQKFETAQEKADRLAKENQSLMDDGVYFIKSIHTEYVLDVPSSSKNPGVNIQLYTLNETDAQKWVLQHDSNGYVTIMNYGSKLYLTASNGRVTQENKSNATNQKWIIMFDAQGRLKIVSATDIKLAIDVASSNFSNGGRIQMYSSNNTGAQQWVFTYIKK
ncbi:RICIN domain-containing protein, partial [Holdemanella biformis]|uniref:RICIN domain-containing protein n=1 Tax=Holdemanella biformis TaxID=1735 RepID=UPI003AB41122